MKTKKEIDDTSLQPFQAVSPGDILREELAAREWTQRTFAEIIGKPDQAVNEIINGKKSITAETAKLFSAALGTSPELWLNLQSHYKLIMEEMASREDSIARKAFLYSILPMSEITKRNWIKKGKNINELEANVCSFFGADNVASIESSLSRLRIGKGRKLHLGAISAWLRKVEIEGAKLDIPAFSPDKLSSCASSIAKLSIDEERGPQRAITKLSEIGVRVIILKHLPGTYIDGAALVDKNGLPTIGLSLRINRLDNFWFTLFHELGHILLHIEQLRKQPIVDTETEGWLDSEKKEEKEANKYAGDILIPPEKYVEFIKSAGGYYSKDKILEFAKSLRISPSIVVGRLHFEGVIGYNKLRRLLVSVKIEAA